MNMNHHFPDWSGAMGDTFAPLGGEDDGLIELMWRNGHVVMQSQAPPRKPPSRPDKAAAAQDDDDAAAAAWFHQYPVPVEEDPLERDDLFSELFGEAQAAVDGGGRGACCRDDAERWGEAPARQSSRVMPPPPQPMPREEKARQGDGAAARTSAGFEATATATEGAESSMLTIASSFCGSNHVQTPPRARDDVTPPGPGAAKDVVARARDAATATSSAARSRSCTTKSEQPCPRAAAAAAAARRSGKRKQSDATDAEDVEYESAAVTREPAQKTTAAKRRRAAEVHNLSERRRRDRINEKMKALQELIPHCNKADKASMLDEAIEYLKSLQLQLQMMWMGGGMAAPVVFPAGMHQYMQRMMAAGPPPHVASLPGMPFMAPPAVQGPPLPDLYARYLAVDHQLPPPPPPPPPPMVAPPYTHYLQAAMGFYQRQNSAPPPPPPPTAVPAASPSDGILHRKYENCGKPEIQGMTGR